MVGRIEVSVVDEGSADFGELLGLVYDVLYRDYGVPEGANWHPPRTADGPVFAARRGTDVVGTIRLVGARGDASMQVRQMAVRADLQRTGIGSALVAAMEDEARRLDASEVWLYARDSAFPFYERLGYDYTGATFVSELTGIPHRPMHKLL